MSSSRRQGRGGFGRGTGRGGFTLLEVLAAAIIMAMFYGVLAAKNVEGFALEGDADRRLRASLVADRRLADLEAARAAGLPPELGLREDVEDEFSVQVEVAPLELPLAAVLAERDAAQPTRRRRDEPAAPSLLAPERGQPVPLLRATIVVAWHDGLAERSVERTTFALDPEAVAAILEQSGLAGAVDDEGNPIFGAPGDGPDLGGLGGTPDGAPGGELR